MDEKNILDKYLINEVSLEKLSICNYHYDINEILEHIPISEILDKIPDSKIQKYINGNNGR